MGMFDTTGRADIVETRSENTLRKLERMNKALRHEEPDRVPISDFFWGGFIQRWREELGLGDDANPYYHYDLDCMKAQIAAADGLLDGMVIWGDVAYRNSMFFSPDYWRTYFKPWVQEMIHECHAHDLPVIYHGCGNVNLIFEDFIEMGVDSYNPLEAKADMDCVDLRRRYGHQFGACGNSNIQVWETGDREKIRAEVLRKLNAAKGGGMIFQSDHSVSSAVTGKTYDFIVNLVREHGKYPLDLGDYDLDMTATTGEQ